MRCAVLLKISYRTDIRARILVQTGNVNRIGDAGSWFGLLFLSGSEGANDDEWNYGNSNSQRNGTNTRR
jgi:hypothetical protein